VSETSAVNARCPRCGGEFHCGAGEARCDCFEIQLDEAQRARLAREFCGCLCLRCLRELRDEQRDSSA
jgi:ribosomal protein L34E